MGTQSKAIVLRGMDYGESNRILRILTEEKGKVSAMARGARKEKSRIREAAEPFTLANFNLTPGRNMYTISQSEIIHSFHTLKESLNGILTAGFMGELVDLFMEENNPDDQMFNLLLHSLKVLEDNLDLWKLSALHFEVSMHVITGIFPDLHQCAYCGSTKTAPTVKIDLDEGGAICSSCTNQKPGEKLYPIESLFLLHEASTTDPKSFVLADHDKDTVDWALAVISRFTSYYIGKELKSRNFLMSVGNDKK